MFYSQAGGTSVKQALRIKCLIVWKTTASLLSSVPMLIKIERRIRESEGLGNRKANVDQWQNDDAR